MRRIEGDLAVVLRRVAYRDSDLVLGLYSRKLGKISVLARGARNSRKRFGGVLGLFSLLEVELTAKPKSTMWTLVSANLSRSYGAFATDIAAMAHGSYGTELVRELTVDEQPDSQLLDLLVALYESLETCGPIAGRLRVFELALLSALGVGPVLDRCVVCATSKLMVGAVLDPEHGGVVCADCSVVSTGQGVRPLSDDARLLLCEAQQATTFSDGDVLDSRADTTAARAAMLGLLYWHVGKPLKSVEFIAKLSNSR